MYSRQISFPRGATLAVLFALAACGGPDTIDLPDGEIAIPDAGLDGGGEQFPDGSAIVNTEFALDRVAPNSGPFIGGNEVILRGNGFLDPTGMTVAPQEVRFGDNLVQPATQRFIDQNRLAVVVPAGSPGIVDVSITIGDETRTAEGAYTYSNLSISPTSGSVAGGTLLEITGSGTVFEEGDTVLLGRSDCTDVEVVSITRITCRTPASLAGVVDVTVQREGEQVGIAEDAYTYFDSTDPVNGGLGGGNLNGSLNVTALNQRTGGPIAGAFVIVGDTLDTPYQGLTDGLGQVTFSGPDLLGEQTVHIIIDCFERQSFRVFDARDVTAFLTEWEPPPERCAPPSMGPPPPPGPGIFLSEIQGELIWSTDFGLGIQPWFNVPEAPEGWIRKAFVYRARRTPTDPFPPPPFGNPIAQDEVLEVIVDGAEDGYPYILEANETFPGGEAVYALAGIENQTTLQFIPYVMGVARDVLTGPGDRIDGVDIRMDIPLDHFLEVQLQDLPPPVAGGPDEFSLQANIDLGGEGFIVMGLLNGTNLFTGQENPFNTVGGRDATRPFRFVAQPALQGALSDGRYRIQAEWLDPVQPNLVTGGVENGVTAVDDIYPFDRFLGIPEVTAPLNGQALPVDRTIRWEVAGEDPDFFWVIVQDANAFPAWEIFVRGDQREATLPDFSALPAVLDLPVGRLDYLVVSVRVPGAVFDEFRYNYRNQALWSRYAINQFRATVPE
jgi:hypothetical protein